MDFIIFRTVTNQSNELYQQFQNSNHPKISLYSQFSLNDFLDISTIVKTYLNNYISVKVSNAIKISTNHLKNKLRAKAHLIINSNMTYTLRVRALEVRYQCLYSGYRLLGRMRAARSLLSRVSAEEASVSAGGRGVGRSGVDAPLSGDEGDGKQPPAAPASLGPATASILADRTSR